MWDNSNIIESYSGVTSPLTFSFARSVYEQVYRQFCALMGVDDALVDRNRHVFANMLGLIRGRVYYNLLNWYRALALLPGFSGNRAFMERMMGVRQKLENPPDAPAAAGRLQDAGRLLRMLGRMTREHRRLEREVPAFHAHVNAVLTPFAEQALATQAPDALLALYRRLEDELLRQWQTPLVNDFFAMIWFGVLGRLVESWLPGEPSTLINDLLAGEGGIVSTEPARRVTELARRVRETPPLQAAFDAQPDDAALWRELDGGFASEVRVYLEQWGDRCANELKLETITPRDEPASLLSTIRSYVAAGVEPPDPAREQEIRRAAEAVVRRGLRGPRRAVFFRVLGQTRRRVRDRENLRFERTRVFGLVRRIMVALGVQLARVGRLDAPRDIFYLTVEEIFGFIDGTATTGDLRGLVALRKAEWDGYTRAPAPPERFTSIGPPELGRWEVPEADAIEAGGDTLQGLGCCPGIVRAPVRVVRDPDQAGDLSGKILVAERTDPGWTLLFPAASGLLVQRGSLLSHYAIVAREVGLPCVVAIPGLLETLQDDETVEMDGTTGRTYLRLRGKMSADARAFWDAHPEAVEGGIIHAGRFERYLRGFRRWVLPLVHSSGTIRALRESQSLDEQRAFYGDRWNTPRWRLLFRVFSSRALMGRLGRDPAFFTHVEGSVAERILHRTRQALTEVPVRTNPYLAYIMTGTYPPEALPRYLRPEHRETIRARLDRVRLVRGGVDEAGSGWDGFNLSDIWEYMTLPEYSTAYRYLVDGARPRARLVYWNLLAPRACPPGECERVRPLTALAEELHARDQAWFYGALHVDEVLG